MFWIRARAGTSAIDEGMRVFSEYEEKVIRILLREQLSADHLTEILGLAQRVSFEQTAGGYFLTVRHSYIPSEWYAYDQPTVTGTLGDLLCGFVVYVENGELTLECHAWGAAEVPADIREQPLAIEVVA